MIALFAFRTFGYSLFVKMKTMPGFTHPTDLFSRITNEQSVCRNSFCYNSPGPDEGVSPNIMPAHDRGIGSDGSPFAHVRFGILTFPVYCATRIGHVREHA